MEVGRGLFRCALVVLESVCGCGTLCCIGIPCATVLALVFLGISQHICREFVDDPNSIFQYIHQGNGGEEDKKWLRQNVKDTQGWCRRYILSEWVPQIHGEWVPQILGTYSVNSVDQPRNNPRATERCYTLLGKEFCHIDQ